MSQLPLSHNDSFARLMKDGYTLFRRGPFVVGLVPFLNCDGQVTEGYLVDIISDSANSMAGPPANHQFHFVGGTPHEIDMTVMNLGGSPNSTVLMEGLTSEWLWSFKPSHRLQPPFYDDYYDKFRYYFDAISAPVAYREPSYDLRPFRSVHSTEDALSPFVLNDEHSARAGIMDLRDCLLKHSVAVIGVGGTGSYVVDLLSKSPVGRITLFDPDVLKVHNSFRLPGPTIREDLGRPKVELLQNRYSHTHKHIIGKPVALSSSNVSEIDGTTFVFLCVDSERVRREIVGLLVARDLPFIDTGMGLNRGLNGLTGMVRTSLFRPESRDLISSEFLSEAEEVIQDEYATNIQTADLNAINAATAVMMFKKYAGYYDELPMSWQSLLTVQSGHTIRYTC